MKYFSNLFLAGLFFILPFLSIAQSDENKTQVVETFKLLNASFTGNAENCIPYDVYAFKWKKSWIAVLNEGNNVDAFIIKPPRHDQKTYIASFYFTQGLSKIVPNVYYYKQKNRRKVVNDLEFYPYYKLKWSGKKAVKGLLLVELPDTSIRPKFFLWRVFSKKQEELKAEVSSLKPDFQKTIDGTNAQLEQDATKALETPPIKEAIEEGAKKKFLGIFGKGK